MNEQTTQPTLRPSALFSGMLILILWIAFGLRAYHLGYQSFWSDEGISLRRSAQPEQSADDTHQCRARGIRRLLA